MSKRKQGLGALCSVKTSGTHNLFLRSDCIRLVLNVGVQKLEVQLPIRLSLVRFLARVSIIPRIKVVVFIEILMYRKEVQI